MMPIMDVKKRWSDLAAHSDTFYFAFVLLNMRWTLIRRAELFLRSVDIISLNDLRRRFSIYWSKRFRHER